jgi:hypothetical protein
MERLVSLCRDIPSPKRSLEGDNSEIEHLN